MVYFSKNKNTRFPLPSISFPEENGLYCSVSPVHCSTTGTAAAVLTVTTIAVFVGAEMRAGLERMPTPSMRGSGAEAGAASGGGGGGGAAGGGKRGDACLAEIQRLEKNRANRRNMMQKARLQ